jgi:hypothetical protein
MMIGRMTAPTARMMSLFRREVQKSTFSDDRRHPGDLRQHARNFAQVKTLLREPVHRIQLAVDVFSQMSDQEIYDFVGIQGL